MAGTRPNGSYRYQSFGKTRSRRPYRNGWLWRASGVAVSLAFLTDAFALPDFARRFAACLAEGRKFETAEGAIVFRPTDAGHRALETPHEGDINWLAAEQSNSSLIIGDALMLKIYRRVSAGTHPEAEMGRYLTEQGFANTPQLLGDVVRIEKHGVQSTLAIALGFVRNQGDAWSWTLDHVSRAAESLAPGKQAKEMEADLLADCDAVVAAIGGRLGEMHAILARPTSDEAFAAEQRYCKRLLLNGRRRCKTGSDKAFASPIASSRGFLGCDRYRRTAPQAALCFFARTIDGHRPNIGRVWRRRLIDGTHGDFHLGQVLVAQRRRLHHRFRGRTGDAVGRASRQNKPATRCCRPPAVH